MKPEVMILSGSDTHFENTMEKKLCRNLEQKFEVEKIDFGDADSIHVQETLEKIREKIKSQGKSFLIGYCLGGTFALLLRTHEKIRGVVAMDPPKGIVDTKGRRFKVNRVYSQEPALIIGSEQAEEGLPETDSDRKILKTSHSFSEKSEKVSELVEEWLEDELQSSAEEAGIHG